MCSCTDPGSTAPRPQYAVTITVEAPDGRVEHDTTHLCAACLGRTRRGLDRAVEWARAAREEQRAHLIRTQEGTVLQMGAAAPPRVVATLRRAGRPGPTDR